MASCNSLYIDVDGLMAALQKACLDMLNEVAEIIIKVFGNAIIAGGAGRTKWRENAAKEFQKISTSVSIDMIEMKLGMREGLESAASSSNYAAQIMVALFGNHGPLYTKPGQTTFHNHMESRDESRATSVWALPAGYNWTDPHPEQMLDNAMKQAEQYFKDGLQQAYDSVNFSDFVIVSGG